MSAKSIKSVHITNYYHKNSGGISTSYNNLLAAAGRQKRQIRLIVPGESDEIEIVNDFAKIYYVAAMKSPIFDTRYRLMMPWQYLLDNSKIRKILIAEKPDIIEVTDKYSLSIIGTMIARGNLRELERPMTVHFSCERMDDNIRSFITRSKLGKWFARKFIGYYVFPSYDFHLANSDYTAAEFHESLAEIGKKAYSREIVNWCWRLLASARIFPKERIHICPCGVDINKFGTGKSSESAKNEIKKNLGIPENPILLLYAGRISPEKNVDLLIDLMKILAKDSKHNFHLVVAGTGPKAEWMRQEAELNFPGKVSFLGHIDKETLANFYANSDVFVHPNPREPFGIGPLEAMASGIPLVAPNSGGILTYANQENASLCNPNCEDFAAAIREIVLHPQLRERKVANALATANQNTREISTDSLLATYDNLYEDFKNRNDLFTDRELAKVFDFSKFQ